MFSLKSSSYILSNIVHTAKQKRSENAPSGRLQEVKNNGKSSTVRPKKWSRSLTGGRLLAVPTVRLWLGKFWCFGGGVKGGGRILRFDCIKIVIWLRGFLVLFLLFSLIFFVLRSLQWIGRQCSREKFAINPPFPLLFKRLPTQAKEIHFNVRHYASQDFSVGVAFKNIFRSFFVPFFTSKVEKS